LPVARPREHARRSGSRCHRTRHRTRCRTGDGSRALNAGRWAERHPLRVGGLSLSLLGVRVVQRFLEVRVLGLSAEMTYYALLSLFPLTGAVGASFGFLERLAGEDAAIAAELAILRAVDAVFSPDVTADVISPLVQGLLREERGGFALTSFLVTLFLASRVFRSAIESLDAAYRVEERRGMVYVWTLGLLFSLAAVLTATIIIAMVVVGPLLGGGRAIAEWLRLGPAFEAAWTLAQWPTVFAMATGFLSLLYRFGPNVRIGWHASLPGAVFGMAGLVLVAAGFRVYIEATGLQSPTVGDAGEAVAVALQLIGALMAALLWLWLSSMVLLTGGVLNAELSRLRGGLPPPAA
jgi:membrane protein